VAKGKAKPVKKKPIIFAPPSPYWRSPVRKWLLSFLQPNGERYRTTFIGTYAQMVQERKERFMASDALDCWAIDTGEDVWRKTLVPSTGKEV
jgi:hypothetical protein